MASHTAYTQSLTDNVALGTTQYAVSIPASAIGAPSFSVGAWRLVFEGGAAPISHVWAGARGAGAVDFGGSQQQVKFSGANGATIPASGQLVSDPVIGSLDLADDFLVVLDGVQTGANYKRKSGLASAFRYHYKAGLGGAANSNTTRTDFEASAAGFTAFLARLEVAESAADFGVSPPPAPPPGSVNSSLAGINEILAGKMFASGGEFAGVAGQMLQVSLFNPAGSGIRAFPRQIVITPEADTIVSCRSIIQPPTGAIVPSHCNLWFNNGASPSSKAKAWMRNQSAFGGDTAQHSIFKIGGGVPHPINQTAYPLAGLSSGGVGFCLAVHTLGIGATVTYEWQEEPI